MSPRKFDCTSFLALPPKNKKNNEMDELLKKSNFEIRSFVNNSFIDDGVSTFEVYCEPYKVKVFDGIAKTGMAVEVAKNFHYQEEVYSIFAKELQTLLLNKLAMLLDCYSATDSDEDILKSYIECLTCSAVDNHNNFEHAETMIRVTEQDRDALFHISRILHVLSIGYQSRHSSGLVLLCQSPSLIVVFHILTKLIYDANPPPGFFHFIPTAGQVSSSPVFSSFHSLFMIFQLADIDAAAFTCMQSALTSEGARYWKPTIVLVEEALEDRFVERLSQMISHCERKEQCPLLCPFPLPTHLAQDVDQYVGHVRDNYGVTVIEPKDGELKMGPVILKDVTPSAIKLERLPYLGPIIHITPFRTIREAMSIASYFAKNTRSHLANPESAAGTPPMIAELWSEASSLIWQVSSHLSDAGIMTIFVNTPYQEKTKTVYNLFPRNCFPVEELRNDEPSNQKLLSNLTSSLNSAMKAQESWYSQGFSGIRNKIHTICRSKSCLKMKIFDAAKSLKKYMKEADFIELLSRSDMQRGGILLARSWCVPTGPIIMVLEKPSIDEKTIELLSFAIFDALTTGNAVIILTMSNDLNRRDESKLPHHFVELQGLLPSNLLQFIEGVKVTKGELKSLLSSIPHTGCFIFTQSHESSDESCNGSIYPYTLPLLRQARLFWSLGGDLFAN